MFNCTLPLNAGSASSPMYMEDLKSLCDSVRKHTKYPNCLEMFIAKTAGVD